MKMFSEISATRALFLSSYRKFMILVILWCVIVSSKTVPAQIVKLNLQEAIILAKQNNESYLIAQQEVKKAKSQITAARSGALPSLRLTGLYQRNWRLPVFVIEGQTIRLGSDNSYTAILSIQQPLYASGKVGAALKIAEYYQDLVQQRLAEAEASLELQVKQAFYDAVLASDLVKVSTEALNQAESNHNVVQKLFQQGMVAEFELLRAQVQVANVKPQLLKARNASELALQNLKTIIGYPLEQQVELIFDFPEEALERTIDYDTALFLAWQRRPELHQLAQQTIIQQKLITIAKGGYKPSVYFSTSYQWQAQTDRFTPDNRDWINSLSSSLTLQIPIFDGFKTSADIQQAQVDYKQTQLRKKQVNEQIALEIKQAVSNWKEARERIEAQRWAVKLAREGLKIAEVRYQNGIGTQLEVIDSQLALITAQTNQVQAYHDFLIAEAQLKKAVGGNL